MTHFVEREVLLPADRLGPACVTLWAIDPIGPGRQGVQIWADPATGEARIRFSKDREDGVTAALKMIVEGSDG